MNRMSGNTDRRRSRGGSRPPAGRRGDRRGYRSRGGAAANSQPTDQSPMPEGMVFYCKSCKQIVDYKPADFNFKYPIENCLKEKSDAPAEKKAEMMCDLAYGTERSIKHYYKIKDDRLDAERREREEKAARADKF